MTVPVEHTERDVLLDAKREYVARGQQLMGDWWREHGSREDVDQYIEWHFTGGVESFERQLAELGALVLLRYPGGPAAFLREHGDEVAS